MHTVFETFVFIHLLCLNFFEISYCLGPEWTNTHQCTNVDGWCTHGCTFFIPPCPWANQGGKLKLTFFFPSLSPSWFLFWELFFSSPPTPAQVSPIYLHLDYCLCTTASSLPPPTYLPTYPPIYLPSHQPIYLCTCTLNLPKTMTMQVDEGISIYKVGCFVFLPPYLPTKPCNFMTVKNNVAMNQLKVLQLN
jgi:hypothetical protein